MGLWNRRQFLSGLLTAVGAEAATVAQASPLAAAASPVTDPAAPRTASPDASLPSSLRAPVAPSPRVPAATSARTVSEGDRALTEVLPEGTSFGRWRLVAVHPVKFGAVPVVLETRGGERFQVDVLARDPRRGSRRGIAQTRHYALYLSNIGRGAKPTREEHGLGVIWLAAMLRAREVSRTPARLLTLAERLQRHPDGRFDALRATASEARSPAPWGPVRSEPVPNLDPFAALERSRQADARALEAPRDPGERSEG